MQQKIEPPYPGNTASSTTTTSVVPAENAASKLGDTADSTAFTPEDTADNPMGYTVARQYSF